MQSHPLELVVHPHRAAAGALMLLLCLVLLACAGSPTQKSTGEFIDDATITARVKTVFARDPEVDALDIDVDTFKGVVQLSGFADTPQQAERAGELAGQIDGVRSVKNDIRLKAESSALPYELVPARLLAASPLTPCTSCASMQCAADTP